MVGNQEEKNWLDRNFPIQPKEMKIRHFPIYLFGAALVFGLMGCASTNIIESPKTAYVSETEVAKDPEVIWTSRTLTRGFDYLGKVKVRSWTYDGALGRLVEGAKTLKADAVIDVHFERIGFLKAMQAFAIKYKD